LSGVAEIAVIPGRRVSVELRCAIAHRRISRFRVRIFDAPRNDGLAMLASRARYFGCGTIRM
jgi:hypothetical protein